jgi:hypothetical protein
MALQHNEITLPKEFSGEAQFILFNRYGDPREPGWEQKWLNTWLVKDAFPWFPEKELHIHKHFRPLLEKAFTSLTVMNMQDEIKTVGKCFETRFIKGSSGVLSVHSWGAAIDMNEEQNPVGSAGIWSEPFIKIMVDSGIYCGQNWTGRKDPMHFAMVNG